MCVRDLFKHAHINGSVWTRPNCEATPAELPKQSRTRKIWMFYIKIDQSEVSLWARKYCGWKARAALGICLERKFPCVQEFLTTVVALKMRSDKIYPNREGPHPCAESTWGPLGGTQGQV